MLTDKNSVTTVRPNHIDSDDCYNNNNEAPKSVPTIHCVERKLSLE